MSKADSTMRGPWDFSAETTLPRLLAANAQTQGEAVAMREKDRGIWQQISWSQWLESMLCCAAGLEALGFAPGTTVPLSYWYLPVQRAHMATLLSDAFPYRLAGIVHITFATQTPAK